MADPREGGKIDLFKWDGTKPCPLLQAQSAVYPISGPDRIELNELYTSGSVHGEALPDRIWPQLDAVISVYRALHEDKQFNSPYGRTKRDLEYMQSRFDKSVEDIRRFYPPDASGKFLFNERFDWIDLELKLRSASHVVGLNMEELKAYQRRTGSDWRHKESFVRVLENILLRNGCSLIQEVPKTRKKKRLVKVLMKIFDLAKIRLGSKTKPESSIMRADNLIKKVALRIHNEFFDLSEEERSRQIALYTTDDGTG